MVRLLPLALALALCGALPLVASAEDESPNRFFEVYDKNQDGRVTPEELGADEGVFRLLDRDGDGQITPEDLGTTAPKPPKRGPGAGPKDGGGGPETRKGGKGSKGGQGGRGGRMKERLLRMDADDDGTISRDEFKGPAELFDRLDKNEDGVLDGPELDAPPQGPGRGGQGRGGQGRGGQGRGGQGRPSPEQWKKNIEAMDVDGDGKITKDEYKGRVPFERLDTNGDGYLDATDLDGMAPRGGQGGRPGGASPEAMREALRKMDANGDGKITKDEYAGPIPFERLDRDGDGTLTEKDLQGRGRGRGAGEGPGRRGRGGGDRAERLRRLDKNGDGKVTREEFPGPDELFDRLDRNGDGQLTEADHPQGAKGGKGGKGGAKGPTTKPAQRAALLDLDKDGNGKLSRNEFPGTDDEWRALDADRDGWVTPVEYAK